MQRNRNRRLNFKLDLSLQLDLKAHQTNMHQRLVTVERVSNLRKTPEMTLPISQVQTLENKPTELHKRL